MNTLRGAWRRYTLASLQADLVAGLVVAVISIPLGLAFAIASGATPIQGLITSVVAGSLVAAFGGSRFQIAGAAAALIPILAGIALKSPNGFADVMLAGMMAGVLLIVMGWLRFGKLIEYIPYPVVLGFTSGIAISIVATQANSLLGLVRHGPAGEKAIDAAGLAQRLPPHEYFHQNLLETLVHLEFTNPWALGLSALTLLAIVAGPRLPAMRRVPGALIGLLAGTGASMALGLPVETIASLFGPVPSTLPAPSLPDLEPSRLLSLVRPAFMIAVLVGVEALLSAVVADNLSGDRHDPNRELVAQGAANLLSPLFGGMPATGVIARTGANIHSGARTRLAGVVHAVIVLAIVWLAAPLASQVPMAVLAAILVVVALRLGEFHHARHLLAHAPAADRAVYLATVALTVLVDLTVAIEVGMVLASLLFIKHMSENTPEELDLAGNTSYKGLTRTGVCPQVLFHEAHGPLFFGVARAFERTIRGALRDFQPKVYVLRMLKVSMMDSTGQRALEGVLHHARHEGKVVVFTRANAQVGAMLDDFVEDGVLQAGSVVANTDEAIRRAMRFVDPQVCVTCKARIFTECAGMPGARDAPDDAAELPSRPLLQETR